MLILSAVKYGSLHVVVAFLAYLQSLQRLYFWHSSFSTTRSCDASKFKLTDCNYLMLKEANRLLMNWIHSVYIQIENQCKFVIFQTNSIRYFNSSIDGSSCF